MKYYLVNQEDETDILPLNGRTVEDAALDAIEQLGWELLTEDEMEDKEDEDLDEVPPEITEEVFEDDLNENRKKRRK